MFKPLEMILPSRTVLSRTSVAVTALGLSALVGCASTSQVAVDRAEGVDLAQCRSFAWHATPNEPASFSEQRVRSQVMATLKEKGYAEATENPSCRIAYAVSSQQRVKSKPGVGVGVGGGSGGIGGGIGVTLPIGNRGEAGRFTLDVIDAAKNAQIWSGTVEDTFESAELTEEEAKRVVEKVLAEFPDAGASRGGER